MEAKKGYGFGNMVIAGLDKGIYTLNINKLNVSISITVHEGVYWETEGFIQKKN